MGVRISLVTRDDHIGLSVRPVQDLSGPWAQVGGYLIEDFRLRPWRGSLYRAGAVGFGSSTLRLADQLRTQEFAVPIRVLRDLDRQNVDRHLLVEKLDQRLELRRYLVGYKDETNPSFPEVLTDTTPEVVVAFRVDVGCTGKLSDGSCCRIIVALELLLKPRAQIV